MAPTLNFRKILSYENRAKRDRFADSYFAFF
jgi:hypothetical protein